MKRVTEALHIVIRNDPELVKAYLDWRIENHIYTLPLSGGSSGPGFIIETISADHRESIKAFFKGWKKKKMKSN